MARWANFAITAVHYDGDSIASVKRSELDDNNKMSNEQIRSKSEVVNAIEGSKKLTYVTYSTKTQNRPRVRVVTGSKGGKFLRSDSDNTAKDNLGTLPTF
jgi:hypothetical protein